MHNRFVRAGEGNRGAL